MARVEPKADACLSGPACQGALFPQWDGKDAIGAGLAIGDFLNRSRECNAERPVEPETREREGNKSQGVLTAYCVHLSTRVTAIKQCTFWVPETPARADGFPTSSWRSAAIVGLSLAGLKCCLLWFTGARTFHLSFFNHPQPGRANATTSFL